mmetsp:Transcript_37973/g.78899  ORF Transcript_37973/g.78899 Transcript_37973/m.78899 type:complete len:122 (+) Transcript_37973:481-846(+)
MSPRISAMSPRMSAMSARIPAKPAAKAGPNQAGAPPPATTPVSAAVQRAWNPFIPVFRLRNNTRTQQAFRYFPSLHGASDADISRSQRKVDSCVERLLSICVGNSRWIERHGDNEENTKKT